MKERGSHGALRIPGTWTNGVTGSSDIEGKAVMGSGENGAAGTRATWMGKPKGRYGREHMSQSVGGERVSSLYVLNQFER